MMHNRDFTEEKILKMPDIAPDRSLARVLPSLGKHESSNSGVNHSRNNSMVNYKYLRKSCDSKRRNPKVIKSAHSYKRFPKDFFPKVSSRDSFDQDQLPEFGKQIKHDMSSKNSIFKNKVHYFKRTPEKLSYNITKKNLRSAQRGPTDANLNKFTFHYSHDRRESCGDIGGSFNGIIYGGSSLSNKRSNTNHGRRSRNDGQLNYNQSENFVHPHRAGLSMISISDLNKGTYINSVKNIPSLDDKIGMNNLRESKIEQSNNMTYVKNIKVLPDISLDTSNSRQAIRCNPHQISSQEVKIKSKERSISKSLEKGEKSNDSSDNDIFTRCRTLDVQNNSQEAREDLNNLNIPPIRNIRIPDNKNTSLNPIEISNKKISNKKNRSKSRIKVPDVFHERSESKKRLRMKVSRSKKNLTKMLKNKLPKTDDNQFTLRCPTERMKREGPKLEVGKFKEYNNAGNPNKEETNNADYSSIDLDQELLGTSYSKSKPENGKRNNYCEGKGDAYLSPNINRKDSMYSRKITGATENTKADSVFKRSEVSNKQIKRGKLQLGFEIESMQSSNMFVTKSEEDEEQKCQKASESSIDNIETAPRIENGDSNPTSNNTSELENSELKETADFFRPSLNASPSKRFSFGRDKCVAKNYNENKNRNFNLKLKLPKEHQKLSPDKKCSKVDLKYPDTYRNILPPSAISLQVPSRNINLSKSTTETKSFLKRLQKTRKKDDKHQLNQDWIKLSPPKKCL
ncbi:unnamed protein product [Moneuplotes crassus]|uniref:Uncharacterized protein n=1 Tax=Euplotes crassus TaxID=5936 RepID=A0AAD2D1H1_EUPCR|nr:unnamed protein product [Moneuplotes crassus]